MGPSIGKNISLPIFTEAILLCSDSSDRGSVFFFTFCLILSFLFFFLSFWLHVLGDILTIYKSVVHKLWWARGPPGKLLENGLVGSTPGVSDSVDLGGGQGIDFLTKNQLALMLLLREAQFERVSSVFCYTNYMWGLAWHPKKPPGEEAAGLTELWAQGSAPAVLKFWIPSQRHGITWWSSLEMQFLRLCLRPTNPAPAF